MADPEKGSRKVALLKYCTDRVFVFGLIYMLICVCLNTVPDPMAVISVAGSIGLGNASFNGANIFEHKGKNPDGKSN